MSNISHENQHRGDHALFCQLAYAEKTGKCPVCKTRNRAVIPVYGIQPTCYDWSCFVIFGFGGTSHNCPPIQYGPVSLDRFGKPVQSQQRT